MRLSLYPFFLTALGLVVGPARAQQPALTIGHVVRQSPALDQILAPGAQLEIISSGHTHVEGPLWVPDSSMLLFSDTKTRTVYRWKAADNKRSKFLEASGYTGRMPYKDEPGSNGLALDGRGNLLFCEHGDRRLAALPLAQPNSGKRTLTDNFQGKRYNSPNDAVVAPDGAVYFTDPPFGLPKLGPSAPRELPFTGVFRRAADGQVTAEATDIPFANGLAFSPDGRTLYVSNADSLRPLILAFEVGKNGKLSKERPFFDMKSLPKIRFKETPDGLKVDQAGNVYAAGVGGLLIISPQGQLLGTIDPGEVVANCAWGDDGHSLYLMATTFVCRIKTLAQGVPGR
ncbi:SMP-30/gluconolactonase/LRE family protein [Hymenobacter sp. HMF4947]|uniref:SMP-30/gluconolactonase/LRE family protein n=1 Tax=Hymenobacter ginkgonis TaxID=2682976 RepID=A0A7K1TFI0_9BACT|nr:SMP-30/gluconolactonase/LRE family protein [Hymenobacter ginkgonis]MVN77169.1 SMP-30/gluconolactonase/LRE family protein [Hymenobacter ginkgonis]